MMVELFDSYFANAEYPCYYLTAAGEFGSNAAAEEEDAPLSDHAAIRQILQGAWQQYRQNSKQISYSIPLLLGAMSMRALTIIPHEEGILAFSADTGRSAPVVAFSAQLREPLTNIFAILNLLGRRLEDDDDLRLAEDIQANCYALLRLTSNLESAARIEKWNVELQPLDLGALVRSLVFCANTICLARDTNISCDVPDEPVIIRGDAQMLNEAILNLLRNSLQYTRDGNRVVIRVRQLDTQAVLTVEDCGLGIKPEHLEHIFTPYYSVDPYGDSAQKPGLGMGLSVVWETAKRLGGSVSAESRFGEGTRINMSFPLDTDSHAVDVLNSDSADYLLNRFSPVYIQLSGFCRYPQL